MESLTDGFADLSRSSGNASKRTWGPLRLRLAGATARRIRNRVRRRYIARRRRQEYVFMVLSIYRFEEFLGRAKRLEIH